MGEVKKIYEIYEFSYLAYGSAVGSKFDFVRPKNLLSRQAKKILCPFLRGSGGLLPQKIFEIEGLRLAKHAFSTKIGRASRDKLLPLL